MQSDTTQFVPTVLRPSFFPAALNSPPPLLPLSNAQPHPWGEASQEEAAGKTQRRLPCGSVDALVVSANGFRDELA